MNLKEELHSALNGAWDDITVDWKKQMSPEMNYGGVGGILLSVEDTDSGETWGECDFHSVVDAFIDSLPTGGEEDKAYSRWCLEMAIELEHQARKLRKFSKKLKQ